MDLSNVSTSKLVEELAKREGVLKKTAEPYQKYKVSIGEETFTNEGPAILLIIED